MDRLYRTTGWSCAWGSFSAALFGGILDFLTGTSGLLTLILAGAGSLSSSYLGLRIGLKDVQDLLSSTNHPFEVIGIHKQHGAMWSLMGAMVGGVVGSTVGTVLAAVGWVLFMRRVPDMMGFMSIVNVMMGGGMGGMTGGVVGAWRSAVRVGFVGEKRKLPLSGQKTKSEV